MGYQRKCEFTLKKEKYELWKNLVFVKIFWNFTTLRSNYQKVVACIWENMSLAWKRFRDQLVVKMINKTPSVRKTADNNIKASKVQ